MDTITYSKVQKLVKQLPTTSLQCAYIFLLELVDKETDVSSQIDFMHLPLDERRRLMTQQAEKMVVHYEQTANECQEWQAGDFIYEH
ncbi:MAG: hypothetical protein QME42_10060 [bacterium]|nr:hypothetical protein [bacterium]